MKNIFKVVEGDISKKGYKNKYNFFQQRVKRVFYARKFLYLRFRKDEYFDTDHRLKTRKKETYLKLKSFFQVLN